jgi:hypothetical protein
LFKKPLLIFNVGASGGAIEAGAKVLETMGWVGGDFPPERSCDGVEVRETHSEFSASSTAVSNPSKSPSVFEALPIVVLHYLIYGHIAGGAEITELMNTRASDRWMRWCGRIKLIVVLHDFLALTVW